VLDYQIGKIKEAQGCFKLSVELHGMSIMSVHAYGFSEKTYLREDVLARPKLVT
jgi:hypothetical protein